MRKATERLCSTLEIEDYGLQAMPDASPPKWHLAHVTWFFETFILKPKLAEYTTPNDKYAYLYNSYYNGAGPQFTRAERGLISRPTVSEVYKFREHVDENMLSLVETTSPEGLGTLGPLAELGCNHEQQHQELLLTDIKYHLSVNPLRPAYHDIEIPRGAQTSPLGWLEFEGGPHWIGHPGGGFAFDNEWPRHQVINRRYRLASRLVTNGEYIEFMEAGGYQTADLWLSEGWQTVQAEGWHAPLYWEKIDGEWWSQTLSGMQPVDLHGPVVHVSYFESDAFAQWSGKRLATEQEWEHAAAQEPIEGNFADSRVHHPLPASGDGSRLEQVYGDVWEWTRSPYVAYPGFRPLPGTVGEYNGKFMVNQMVLRGGSCATPRSHIRPTYRNFFPPDSRWQFSGIRLAEDA